MQLQRKIALKQSKIIFRHDHMYELEIDGQSPDLNLYCKSVSYGKGTIESDSKKIGSGMINLPANRTAGSITVVFYDTEMGDVSNFIKELQDKIFNDDGTQNLPVDYLFKVRIYRILDSGEKILDGEWRVYVEENNDYSGDNDAVAERGTFTATFKKYRSIGLKK